LTADLLKGSVKTGQLFFEEGRFNNIIIKTNNKKNKSVMLRFFRIKLRFLMKTIETSVLNKQPEDLSSSEDDVC
jgi:hypothetical protein